MGREGERQRRVGEGWRQIGSQRKREDERGGGRQKSSAEPRQRAQDPGRAREERDRKMTERHGEGRSCTKGYLRDEIVREERLQRGTERAKL
jgi:hypothetical protein